MTVQVVDHSREFLRNAETEVEKAVAQGAIEIQAEVKRIINRFESPPRSLPGEPPHKETGHLGRSIDQETFQRDAEFVGRIGTNVRYGRYLEIGTSRMVKRPYLRPSLDKMRNSIVALIRAAGKRMER